MIIGLGLLVVISMGAAIWLRAAWFSFISRAVFVFVAIIATMLTGTYFERDTTPLDLAVILQGAIVCSDIGWFGKLTNACANTIIQEAIDGWERTRED